MELKKSKKADLERKRPLWFLIGLVMPTLVFVALLELVTWSGRSSTSDNALDDFLEEMEQRPKKEREDMVAAMDVRKQKPKEAERVNIVDEPKAMEPLKTIADTYIEGDEEGAPSADKDDKKKDDTQVAAVDMGDNPLNFRIVEQLPEFPGGMSAFVKWITDNLKYPYSAQNQKIKGRVVITFIVNSDGTTSDLKVSKSAHPILDREAMRVMRMMPRWKPGVANNRPCRTMMAIPVEFAL